MLDLWTFGAESRLGPFGDCFWDTGDQHDGGEKIDAKKKTNDVAVSLGVLGIALEGCIQHEGRTC